MFVDTALLHLGASESRDAGDQARQAAERLSGAESVSEMFGAFGIAAAFHEAMESLQAQHVRVLSRHQETLESIGRGAAVAAAEFTQMEQDNATRVRAVWCDSGT